jgi:hypothetical protein
MILADHVVRCFDDSCPWKQTCRRWTEREQSRFGGYLPRKETMRDYLLKRCEYRIPTEPKA